MPLIPRSRPNPDRLEACDYDHAQRLRDRIVAVGRYRSGWRKSGWAAEFAKLRKAVDDDARVRAAVDWYCRNAGKPYVPVVLSAAQFREKFVQIELAAARGDGRRRKLADVEPSEEAERLAAHLVGLGWPKGSRDALPAFVQANMDAVESLKTKLKDAAGSVRPNHPAVRLVNHFLSQLPSPANFAGEWVQTVHARVAGWAGWSGDLLPQVFDPARTYGLAWGRGKAAEYSGDPQDWDRAMALVDVRVGE